MPTPTYDLISEQVLGSATATVTFSSIAGTYKDLVIEITGVLATQDGYGPLLRLNNDSSTTVYSLTTLYGNGTTATSSRRTTTNALTSLFFSYGVGWSTTAANVGTATAHVMSYSNGSINKTVLFRQSMASGSFPGAETTVGLYQSTAAITRLDVIAGNSGTFATGFTARLWGIA